MQSFKKYNTNKHIEDYYQTVAAASAHKVEVLTYCVE